MNVNELEAGADLDYWTGRAMGLDVVLHDHPRDPTKHCWERVPNPNPVCSYRGYRPSTDKRQAFEVLETFSDFSSYGKTFGVHNIETYMLCARHESLLVRICRCKVLLVFGNNLPIEKE